MADAALVDLRLLGQFSVRRAGEPVSLAPTGQRVLAGIALLGGVTNRSRLAGTLWPDHRAVRSHANLRGAVARLPRCLRRELSTTSSTVGFNDRWSVDIDNASLWARRLRDDRDWSSCDCLIFAQDLLPDWSEEWLLVQRERHRQLRLHALEDLARIQLEAGDALTAVDTALQAVTADELRESAQYLLLEAHLAAGNRAAAAGQFRHFRALLHNELGVEPSASTLALVTDAGISP